MKTLRLIGRTALSLALGSAISSSAQQPQPGHPLGDGVQNVDKAGVGLIPNYLYRAHFGEDHKFHLRGNTYGQDGRFQHGGYSFGFVDEWPTNWLSTEDVFVTQIDGGYYLCNGKYPGVNIPLKVATPVNRSSASRNTVTRDASVPVRRSITPKASRAKAVTSASASAG